LTDKEKTPRPCDVCGSGKAVVHLTQVVNNQMTTLHLCQRCAAEKGLQAAGGSSGHPPLVDFLAKMGGGESAPAGEAGGESACPFCGLSAADFKQVGRLGCPHCYATFETHIKGLLRRIHGSTQHVGKVYLPPDPSITEKEKRLNALRQKLQRAVSLEDFERAAKLRDQIRSLEPTS
jgi:protein arginine kinase activator